MKKQILYSILTLGLCYGIGRAQFAPAPYSNGSDYTGYLVNSIGIPYSTTWSIDMSNFKGSRVSAQVLTSSGNYSAVTFSTANYSLGSSSIAATSHGLPLALPVLYATNGATAITGLTNQTTYYIIPINSNTVQVATTSARAILGLPVVLASRPAAGSGYTLTPIAWSGTASLVWESSNDNANWSTVTFTSSVSYTSSSAAADNIVDFGFYDYRYLRLNFTAPTWGAMVLQVPVLIKQDGIGTF